MFERCIISNEQMFSYEVMKVKIIYEDYKIIEYKIKNKTYIKDKLINKTFLVRPGNDFEDDILFIEIKTNHETISLRKSWDDIELNIWFML